MSGHGAVLCGHGAVDHQGHGQVFAGYPIVFKGHHFLAAGKTLTSYAPAYIRKSKATPTVTFEKTSHRKTGPSPLFIKELV